MINITVASLAIAACVWFFLNRKAKKRSGNTRRKEVLFSRVIVAISKTCELTLPGTGHPCLGQATQEYEGKAICDECLPASGELES